MRLAKMATRWSRSLRPQERTCVVRAAAGFALDSVIHPSGHGATHDPAPFSTADRGRVGRCFEADVAALSQTIGYSWDLNGDGVYGDSTLAKPTYTHAQPGVYTVRLKVTDNQGASTISAPITITANTMPPTPTAPRASPPASMSTSFSTDRPSPTPLVENLAGLQRQGPGEQPVRIATGHAAGAHRHRWCCCR
jgi:hypothetical protein